MHLMKMKMQKRRKLRKRKPTAKRALNVAKKALKLVQSDMKWYDSESTGTLTYLTNATAPVVYALNDMAQGAGEQDFVGNSYMAKSINLHIRLFTQYELPAMPSLNYIWSTPLIRVIVFYEKDTSDTLRAPAITDLLQTNSDGIDAFINMYNRNNFKVLYNKVHSLSKSKPVSSLVSNGTTSPPAFNNDQLHINIYKKLNRITQFGEVSAGTYYPRKNGLYLCIYQDDESLTTTAPQVPTVVVQDTSWRLTYINV